MREPFTPKLASAEARIKSRNEQIAELRQRSGLSLDDLAKDMGFKGQSSIQRYLSPSYDKGFRPELAARFKAALLGRGTPPISPRDLSVFDNWAETDDGVTLDLLKILTNHFDTGQPAGDFNKRLEELGLLPKNDIAQILTEMRRSKALGVEENDRVVALPLLEGNVVLKMPDHLSAESAQTLRDWVDHLITLATKTPPGTNK